MGTKIEGDGCYAAAMPDEPMFVMLARDESAPALVRQWGAIRAMEIRIGRRPESDWAKVDEAYALADRMVVWREAADESWRKQGSLFETACCGTTQRQGDEIACSCGKRWGVDEVAPDGHL